jgi:integrase
MAARQIDGFWHVDFWFDHSDGQRERIRKKCPVNTKKGADEYERQIRAQLLAGTYGKPEQATITIPTFREYAETFLSTYAKNNNKPSEIRSKRMRLRNHLTPFFGDYRLNAIGTASIEQFKKKKLDEGKLERKSINNSLIVLSRMLRVAYQEISEQVEAHKQAGTLPADYFVNWTVPRVVLFKQPRFQDQKVEFLSVAEVMAFISAYDRLIAKTRGDEIRRRLIVYRGMVILAVNAGLRLGELMGLHWSDVDLKAGKLTVRHNLWHEMERGKVQKPVLGTPKGGQNRDVPLTEAAVSMLRSLPRRLGSKLVFTDADGGFLSHQAGRSSLVSASAEAGIKPVHWHMLRHTFASHLVMRGVPLRVVQQLLGHASIEVTERYAHLSPEVNREAVLELDQIFVPSAPAEFGQPLGRNGDVVNFPARK